MNKLIILFSILVLANASTMGQIKTTYKKDLLVAVFGMLDSTEMEACAPFILSGTVVKVRGEYPEMILDLRTSKGIEGIGYNTEDFSMADRGNLHYTLLKRNKRVRVKGLMCGSGAFHYADSIEAL